MALTDDSNGNGFYMPVAPAAYGGGYGNSGFGSDWGWIVLLLLLAGLGGWGGMGMGGFGGFGGGLGIDFPWLLNGQQGISNNVSDGFRDAQLHDSVTSVRDGVSNLATQLCNCCGDMQMSLANGFAGTAAAITGAQNALSQQLYSNELASLNRSFAEQAANVQGFTSVNSGLADLKYTVATENCADRAAVSDGIRDVITAQTANTQAILDKLCALELDGFKRENDNLRQQLNMAQIAASQTAQNAFIQQGLNSEVDALYNRLSNCPVPSVPVYGRQPIFSCQNNGCGCGNGSF